MLGALVAVALVFSACGPDDGGENNGGNNGGGGGNNQEYPSTADVIFNAVKDVDGNNYDAVKIGNQVWMASNLRTTRYADGTGIPSNLRTTRYADGTGIPFGDTMSYDTPYRYAPGLGKTNEANMVNVPAYGYLYNWAAVMRGASSSNANPSGVQGICPKGWHVPSDAEWTQLTDYMATRPEYMSSGNRDYLAKALAATWGWYSSSEPDAVGYKPSTTNNATGFSALPAGGYDENFKDFGYNTCFWSTDDYLVDFAWLQYLGCTEAYVDWTGRSKNKAFSVRCLRDE